RTCCHHASQLSAGGNQFFCRIDGRRHRCADEPFVQRKGIGAAIERLRGKVHDYVGHIAPPCKECLREHRPHPYHCHGHKRFPPLSRQFDLSFDSEKTNRFVRESLSWRKLPAVEKDFKGGT